MPQNGQLRVNDALGINEVFDGSVWVEITQTAAEYMVRRYPTMNNDVRIMPIIEQNRLPGAYVNIEAAMTDTNRQISMNDRATLAWGRSVHQEIRRMPSNQGIRPTPLTYAAQNIGVVQTPVTTEAVDRSECRRCMAPRYWLNTTPNYGIGSGGIPPRNDRKRCTTNEHHTTFTLLLRVWCGYHGATISSAK